MVDSREILTINTDNYQVGDLSLFPQNLDDDISLYQAANNAISVLTGRLYTDSESVYVNDNGFFPDRGIIRINDELIYYKSKQNGVFLDLIRGFNFTSPMNHSVGSVVLGCVDSLHHNSIRDSVIKCESKTGLVSDLPDINGTLTSRVNFLNIKWFTPTSRFFAFPRKGRAPLTVNFRNFSLGEPYINSNITWDFGDINNPDTENISSKHAVHTYKNPGIYTITLHISAPDGRSSFLIKSNYIQIYDDYSVVDLIAYARDPKTLEKLKINEFGSPTYISQIPFEVQFIDQTLGLVKARRWNFGDGNIVDINTNPYDHIINHTYVSNGIFWPELQVLDQNDTLRTYKFKQPIIVGVGRISANEILLGRPISDINLTTIPTLKSRYSFKTDEDKIKESLII